MAIYDKDGNVYKLKGAARKPIDNSQWDKVIVHNFEWSDVTLPDELPNVTKFKSDIEKVAEPVTIPTIRESKTVEEPEPVIDEIKQPEEPEPVVEYKNDDSNRLLRDNKVLMWCLPMKRVEKVDPVYQESHWVYEAGNKFRFEGIVVNQQDLVIHFWTRNVVMEPNYVISVIGNKAVRESRWWKVYKVEDKSGGLLVEAIPSDYSPDFS